MLPYEAKQKFKGIKMTSIQKLSTTLLLFTALVIAFSCTGEHHSQPETGAAALSDAPQIPLIYHMSFMSRYTKKLWFAGMEENWDLAYLYSHEVEEIGEDLIDGEYVHKTHRLAPLLEAMLLPQVEEVEEAIMARDLVLFESSYRNLIQSCNSCHVATDYGVVKVAVPTVNPFNQDFSPAQ